MTLALLLASVGCRSPGALVAPMARTPDAATATGHERCRSRNPTERPLLIEWGAGDRAELEALAQRQVIAVRYDACTLRVLPACEVPGRYDFAALTPKRETVTIDGVDELYAQLPLGAARLEAHLDRAHALEVDLVIVGRAHADGARFTADALQGRCEGATHIVGAITVGAFQLRTRAKAAVGVQADWSGITARGSTAHDAQVLRRDGTPEACTSVDGAEGPPTDCGASLRVDLVPIEPSATGGGVDPRDANSLRARRAKAGSDAAYSLGAISLFVGLVGGILYGTRETAEDPSARGQLGVGLIAGGLSVAAAGLTAGGILQWHVGRIGRQRRGAWSIAPTWLGGGRSAGFAIGGRF
jgi:hypothetical protein